MTSDATHITETRIGRATARLDRQAFTLNLLREFEAPRERVFDAFGTCEALTRWLPPADWTLPHCEMDFRPGGTCTYAMRAPAGMTGPNGEDPWESWGRTHYESIERPERISYRDAFIDEHGDAVPDLPEMRVTIRFVDLGGGRTSLVNTTQFESLDALEGGAAMGMDEGWAQSLDKLEALLAEPVG